MKPFLTELAKASGCRDLGRLDDVLSSVKGTGHGSILLAIFEAGLVDEENFLSGLAAELELPWIEATPEWLDDDARSLRQHCSAELALKHHLLPLHLDEKNERLILHLATYDPLDLARHAVVSHHIDIPDAWSLATPTIIADGLQKLYGVGAETFAELLQSRENEDNLDGLMIGEETMILDDDNDEQASVVSFVNQILRGALEQRATDIHLEPMGRQFRIRYRIDGQLQEVPAPENIYAFQASVISRLKIMARLDIAEKRLPQDGRIQLELDGRAIDVRVATIPSVEGESISLRLLGQESFSLEKLGINEHLRRTVDQLLALPNGIVLVTGPTGSGKSTTLYCFLSQINTAERRIVTIEDPVENKLPGVVQIAVKPDIDLTFARGLRSILRGDPNVVMVGEMRDLETTEIAIRAALTGHLVFSTLHTNDAIGGITRLVDMGVEPFLVSSSVRAFLAQRLVRRLCQACRVPKTLDADSVRALGFDPEGESEVETFTSSGCPSCRGTGFHGRMALFEICVLTQNLQDNIIRGATARELRAQAEQDGFVSMREDGWEKIRQGETTLEEVLSATMSDLGDSIESPSATNISVPLPLVQVPG
jgi:type II secretory ATPase GspE/PulE/Tfp pilus assembly ATPase PilB-like protein